MIADFIGGNVGTNRNDAEWYTASQLQAVLRPPEKQGALELALTNKTYGQVRR